jgi:hypothetical protein
MSYWLVIREILGVRSCEGVFKSKSDAEGYGRSEGYGRYDVEYWPVNGVKADDDRIFVASGYIPSVDLFEFSGLYYSYDRATSALKNRFDSEKQLVLGLIPA